MIIANLATFPGRLGVLPQVVKKILPQVDKLNICLNEYDDIPDFLNSDKINAVIPCENYRDVGKFIVNDFDINDDVFYIDDDIVYPDNYIDKMIKSRDELPFENAILGVHGVIYPDAYDGSVESRVVFAFKRKLDEFRTVNQLGTGTVLCKGYQAAPLSFMNNSQRFVDVRYARYCLKNMWPLICVPRAEKWLDEVAHDDTIFSQFTKKWPLDVVLECQEIAGYSKLI